MVHNPELTINDAKVSFKFPPEYNLVKLQERVFEACQNEGKLLISKTILATTIYREDGETGVVAAADSLSTPRLPNSTPKEFLKIRPIREQKHKIYALLAGSSTSAVSLINVMKKFDDERKKSTIGEIAKVGFCYLKSMQILECTVLVVGWDPLVGEYTIYVISGKAGFQKCETVL
ncbi:hypothetical protein FRX31_015183 [Thalictrum thalictroides]|uniref:Uncharacterized protein n=1 Tax=Thalictrum thalictroides TaxID=46969 RepID=A0A7J6WD15_THATH|nr:hypothetical protein FRX31_015183 [Thalictrum thalictroides]